MKGADTYRVEHQRGDSTWWDNNPIIYQINQKINKSHILQTFGQTKKNALKKEHTVV